ncbi:MAG: hypothetical protein COA78_23230 [Blastopirellula sp.]|nr:MAG: hypothetical protein COA78_23230 [Blastopirellula sp.]
MKYSDLQEESWWHHPESAYDPSLPKEFDAVMIGWLGNKVESIGVISDADLQHLEDLCETRYIDQALLGYHTCEICNKYDDRGEVLLIHEDKYFVVPHMIIHYVKDHKYLPPDEFLSALDQIEA